MTILHDLVTELTTGPASRLFLPEHRQIELYSKRKNLSFAAPEPASDVPQAEMAGACRAFMALDAYFAFVHPSAEPQTTWLKYLALPRSGPCAKQIAELYRMLRIMKEVAFHSFGHIEMDDGVVKINGTINRVALSLEITTAGLRLLESAVAYYLGSLSQPYPDAYVDAMLSQYFTDIVAETKRFADEDRILYQFRQKFPFNRHFRFDCDNPKIKPVDGGLHFEVGAIHRDPARTPIDFFAIIDQTLHIIPVEALTNFTLPLDEVAQWRARTSDGLTLPAHFRSRFGREVMVVGQPMT